MNVVVSAVDVTLALAVHAVSQSLMLAVTALASVIVLLSCVQIPVTPRLLSFGLAMMRMVSPGAVRAAVAPEAKVFQRVANEVPADASLPPTWSKKKVAI